MVKLVSKLDKLRERCDEFNVFENQDTIKEVSGDMIEYMNKHEDIKALAAPMINRNYRMFAIRFSDGIKFFLNSMFTKQEGLHVSIETNPLFKDRSFLVARNDTIGLAYQDLFGMAGEADFDGTAGDLIQQMVYLTDGILLDELGFEVFDDFLSATKEEQAEVIDYYLNTLKDKTKEINDEIENNPELKEYKEGMDFLQAAARGEVQIETPKLSNRKQRRIDKIKQRLKHFGRNFTKKKKKRK